MPLSHEIFSMRNLLDNAPKFSTEDIKNTFAKMLLNLPLMMTAQPRPFPSQFLFPFLYFFPVHIFLLRSPFPPSTWAPLTNWKCNLAKVQQCVAYYCAPPRPSATLWPLLAACPLPYRQRGALAIVQAGQRTSRPTEVAVSRWLKVPAVTQNVWKTMQFFHLSLPHTHTLTCTCTCTSRVRSCMFNAWFCIFCSKEWPEGQSQSQLVLARRLSACSIFMTCSGQLW